MNAQWISMPHFTNTLFQSTHFTDPNTGYIPNGNVVLKTTDGANNFNVQPIGGFIFFKHIYFVDSNIGYVFGGNSPTEIYKTIDGGNSWIPQVSGINQYINDVFFINANTGFAVGDNGTVIKTTNGGINWNLISGGSSVSFQSVFFTSADTGYIAGPIGFSSGVMLRTYDGGNNWDTILNNNNFLASIFFTSADTGYVAGATAAFGPGLILKTVDGGNNWVSQPNTALASFYSISFSPTNHNIGYAVGWDGIIVSTTNGGNIWNMQTSPTTRDLWDVQCVGGDTAYAVGDFGTILKTENIITWVNDNKNYDNFFISPNPANDWVNIESEHMVNSINIYDYSGKFISSKSVINNKIETTDLISGLYFFKFSVNDVQQVVKKVIIQK